jgi:hypothetical protein
MQDLKLSGLLKLVKLSWAISHVSWLEIKNADVSGTNRHDLTSGPDDGNGDALRNICNFE